MCWLDSIIIAQVCLRLTTIQGRPRVTTPAQDLYIQHLHLQDRLRPLLRMSTLWIEWPMVVVGLWYGQAYVMDNEHRCILLMAFWMHRDTVTRSWGPLLCHSSTTISSCCSMIMHGPVLQGSLHNYWKLKTSQFLHGQHTHRTCHPLSMFGMLWIGLYDSVFQFLPISSNFAQPLKRSEPTFNRPQSTTWSTLCEGDVLHCVRQMVVTPDTDWFSVLMILMIDDEMILLFNIIIYIFSIIIYLVLFY